MKKFLLLIIPSISISLAAYAQPALAWSQRYNGPPDNEDEAVSIAVDPAGNSYVTGSAYASNGTLDMVTIKYSPGGQQMWLQSYNGSANDNDQAFQVVLDAAGNVYVTGYSKSTASMQDITTIKYNNSGVQQWVSFYNGAFNNYDQGVGLAVDPSGNVYVSGYETTSNYTYDFVTLKYDAAGNQQWVQTYDGPGNFNDEPYDIGLDANNNVFVCGTQDTFYNSQPNEDMILMKYSSSGTLLWKRIYDTPTHGYEYCKKLAIDRNNDIVLGGYAFITGNGFDYHVLKWNNAGVFQWMSTYNYAANTFENPADIITDSLNNVIITGQGITPSSGNTNDYVTVKYNSAGTFMWASRYGNVASGDDKATAIAVDDSMNIYVTGSSKGSSTMLDIATVKYDPAGNQVYVLRYDNPNASKDDYGNAIALNNGDIYIAGKSANLTNGDYLTLRYSYSAIGINESENVLSNVSVFPNPSSGTLQVCIPQNVANSGKIIHSEMIDELGQTVSVSGPLSTEPIDGKSIIRVNTADMHPGVYFIKVFAGNDEIGISKFVIE